MRFTRDTVAALGITSILNSVTAQNLSYGADNFYRSNNVTLQPITFQNQYQMTIAGNLFTPDNLTSNAAPAIVVGHPMGAVKEQSANLYATKLAEQGFVALSFDHQFWGGSDGEPRNAVSPDLYAEGFSAAVDYLGMQSFVDRERIGAVGICGSGGFLISAAKIDTRLKAIATASMYNMGTLNRNGLQHSQDVQQRMQIIDQASQQRWTELDVGEVQYTGGTANTYSPNLPPVQREFYDFYRTSRGEYTPAGSTVNITTHPTFSSNVKFMNFYPFNDIETISPRPLLFISGDIAHSREFSEDAYQRAAEPKELLWVSGAGHVDLYDRVDMIPFNRLIHFFRTNLAANQIANTNETVHGIQTASLRGG
ncbi:hypothetical protein EIK77_003399 [Talaromyces pinophilus]|nr:hypothetical protein EIK77_003399 [Talaromyces pinophilus]PCG97583.1 Hypothetical protein PENO1_062560 [Penicillium occitanis (nom. inval.)]PCG98237.1 hypothetical protein PENOC_064190 [Penicillium occitanis (nom. inval.)]